MFDKDRTKHRFANISQLLFHFSSAERYITHKSDITDDNTEKNTAQAALVERSKLVILNLWLYMTAILILYVEASRSIITFSFRSIFAGNSHLGGAGNILTSDTSVASIPARFWFKRITSSVQT